MSNLAQFTHRNTTIHFSSATSQSKFNSASLHWDLCHASPYSWSHFSATVAIDFNYTYY